MRPQGYLRSGATPPRIMSPNGPSTPPPSTISNLRARCSELERELQKTRRELKSLRSTLQRDKARAPPLTANAAVSALSVALNHMLPQALLDVRAEQERLREQVAHLDALVFCLETEQEGLMNEIWSTAYAGHRGETDPNDALSEIRVLVEQELGAP